MDAARVTQEMLDYLSNDSSSNLESKQIPLSEYPKKWEQKRKHSEESDSDEENEEVEENENEKQAEEEFQRNKKK